MTNTYSKRAIFASVIGNALEYYDYMIYGFFAVMLAPLFFPTSDPFWIQVAGMASFSAVFVMRPVGGLIFGHIGDCIGRKQALIISILLVSVPTIAIGLLPTYAQIGILAPIILLVCRLLQGFSVGGESSGAMTFVLEHADKKVHGLMSGIVVASCYIGAAISTLIGAFFTLGFMPSWAWRATFIIGGSLGLAGYYLRRALGESSEFLQAKKKVKAQSAPAIRLMANKKMGLAVAFSLGANIVMPFSLVFIYANNLLKNNIGMESWQILLNNTAVMIIWAVMVLLMGHLADRIGAKRVMSYSAAGIILVAYPIFWLIDGTMDPYRVAIMQIVLCIPGAGFAAPCCVRLREVFPVELRYSGVAIGYSLGSAVFGFFGPISIPFLIRWTGDATAPAIILGVTGIIGWLAVNADVQHSNDTSLETQDPELQTV